MNNFFYDGQIRRFLYQFIRIFSHFQVEFGKDRDGNTTLQQVPCFYGDPSRQAAQILRGNTENATPTVPAIACYISALDYDRNRVQEPYHVSKMNLRMRSYEHATPPAEGGTWSSAQGDAFSVERLMPVPYKLTLKVDIWTSNHEQKLQLQEQILPLFNPALEIQSTDNYIDWTSLSAIYLLSNNWSSRSVGTGYEDALDITTLTFELPIWLSLPAKVKQLGVIHKIISSLYDANGELSADVMNFPMNILLAQRAFTPLNYKVVYFNNSLELFKSSDIVVDNYNTTDITGDNVYHWKTLVDSYGGVLTNGVTEVRLEQPNGATVVGTVSYHPTNPALLIFNPITDTIPSNTLPAVNAIIDPFSMPVDSTYLNASIGTRYLILNDIGSTTNTEAAVAWHGVDDTDLIAKANDVIEYNGNSWFVSFSASSVTEVKYLTNIKSGAQYRWVHEEQTWQKSIEGVYSEGNWSIVLAT